MKNITLLLILSFFLSLSLYSAPKPVNSKIEKVTVFRSGAQVTRNASIGIPSGNSELIFIDLPASMDPKNLQFKSSGKFKVLSVEHQLNYFSEEIPESKVATLRDELKKLRLKQRRQQQVLDVYKKEEEMILANKSIGGQQTGVNIEDLKATANFYRERLTELRNKSLDITIALEELKEEMNKYNQQLRELNTPERKSTSEIKVSISSKVATTGKFTIGYWVANAGWTPSYDLRVKNIKKPLNLVYKASVHQNSGEDWKAVDLTLSSGNPVEGATAPELQPWYLNIQAKTYRASGYSTRRNYDAYVKNYNYQRMKTVQGYVRDETGEALPGANVLLYGTSNGTSTNLDGFYSMQVPSNAVLTFSYVGFDNLTLVVGSQTYINANLQAGAVLEEVVVTGAKGYRKKNEKKKLPEDKPILAIQEVKQTNVEFKVEEPYTVLSDGQKKVVEMSEHSLPAEYRYLCIPKLDLDAFLTARVTGWDDHNLLNGEANLFFEGTYLGKTVLDLENTSDTLDISLGRDKSIIVTREKQKDYGEKQSLGGSQKETRSWEISIRNSKRQEIDLLLVDQFPVSTSKAIQVEQLESSDGKVDEDSGKVTWVLKIKPTTTIKKQLKYLVKYSKKDVVIVD